MAIWIRADNNEVTIVLHYRTDLVTLIVTILNIREINKVIGYRICIVILICVHVT